MSNTQKAEKLVNGDGQQLQVHSIFKTLQGEGPYAGRPAIFVRLAGCNLACPGCDTEYTKGRVTMTPEELCHDIHQAVECDKVRLVVITGGEPFRQPLGPFIETLLEDGFEVQLETNGTLYQELPFDRIKLICSPKTGSINRLLAPHLTAIKYVVDAGAIGEDGYPNRALDNGRSKLARPPAGFKGTIYLQPYDSGDPQKNKTHEQAAIQSCFQTGGTYCHQIHKLLDLE